MGRGNKGSVGGFEHTPSGDPAGATSLLLLVVFIVGWLVASLCRRRKKTQRNKEECRRLMERVRWLRDLLQLLRSSAAAAAPPQMTMEEEGAAPTTTARRHHLRAALAGSLDAAVSEADGLASSWAMRCCLCGFARCYAVARKLERTKADVDEIYGQVLPVVSQVDATHRAVHMLLGMGALPHSVITETTQTTPTTSQNGGGDDRNSSADSHSGIQLAGFEGIDEAPIEFDFNSWAEQDGHVYHYQQERRLLDRPPEIDHEIN